jgi:branched-chain amino acid transport system ATP-binding protein
VSPILAVSGLSKSFGGIPAAREASFAVEEGEVVGVIGPNGSGKSTLLGCVLGQLAPDAGTIRFAGREITGLLAGPAAELLAKPRAHALFLGGDLGRTG